MKPKSELLSRATWKALQRLLPPLAAMLLAAILPAQKLSAQQVTLPGHVIKALEKANRLPHGAEIDQEPITLTVVLNLSDPEGAKSAQEEYVDPNSPNYHQTMSAEVFTARFGPSHEAYDAVLAYLEQNGFTLVAGSENRRTITVRGVRAQAQKTFNVMIDNYQLGERTFHAVASDPIVPPSIAPMIGSVSGLSNLAKWHPARGPSPPVPMSQATAYGGTLTPTGTTNTGGSLPPGLDGQGQTIGLIELDGFVDSDVINWLSYAKLPAKMINQLTTIPVNGGVAPSGCDQTQIFPPCGTTEVLLDIEQAMGVAQGADIRVYSAPPGTDYPTVFNYALNDLKNYPKGAVLSMSWYQCEQDMSSSDAVSVDGMVASAMMNGITVFAATGDYGATCVDLNGPNANSIASPADAPHVIAVGGTTLNVDLGPGNIYLSESWWLSGGNSGGFGVSDAADGFFAEPSFQTTFYPGAAGRSVPDVSSEAALSLIVCQANTTTTPDCGATINGGTSIAAPFWAATWALANQAIADSGTVAWSPAYGYFYRHTGGFHPPSTMTGSGNDFKHVGLGSPIMTQLIAEAVPARIDGFSPANGPGAGGTTVTVQGAGFIGVYNVIIGGVPAKSFTIESDNKLSFVTPVAPSESATIVVATLGSSAKSAEPFFYDPEITGISPLQGPMQGGTSVTVSGHALSASLVFEFGDTSHLATHISCSSAEKCTMDTPADVPGPQIVYAYSTSDYVLSSTSAVFNYEGPAITSISPLVGPTTGGEVVEIQGNSLQSGKTTVSFGGLGVAVTACNGDTLCFVTSPAHAAGSVPVTVTVNGLTSKPYAKDFTFEAFPTLTKITPNIGPAGTVVTLTGTGFSTTAGQTIFTFFGIPVSGSCTSTTQCMTVVPENSEPGVQYTQVTVTVAGNTSLDSVQFGYPKPNPIPRCQPGTCN